MSSQMNEDPSERVPSLAVLRVSVPLARVSGIKMCRIGWLEVVGRARVASGERPP